MPNPEPAGPPGGSRPPEAARIADADLLAARDLWRRTAAPRLRDLLDARTRQKASRLGG